ncbi:NAD-dependent epimerase/dehydratase family protein [Legionella sp. km772]|uniref:NAD-dependent epimerase/dehydratase family protein n=1 Tax=Legionella sp. km772 TaxID=2498111 RepID=UPI000F8C781D|nr:NAD-dependent epimerase/dehydratase family protein [Legionella sp. km772]RUR12752.1 NAD-dependent epimerase/dehydratase family protein [Legionella sp. km772]
MQKILVTGATGFVGRSLVPALQTAGYDVVCAVSKPVDWINARQVVINRLELMDDWSSILPGIDVIIHLAAKVHVMQGNVPLDEFCKVNSIATKKLAEQAAQHGVRRFIFLSSIKVNGEFTLEGAPFTEENCQNLEDPYGQSKLLAEQNLLELSQQSSMDVVILRPSLIFGPGVKANFLKMMQLVNKGLPLPFGGIRNKRNFVFIENLISAIEAVINEPKAANQVYLIADNEAWSLSELLSFIAQTMNKKSRLITVPGLLRLFKLFGLTALSTRLFGSLEVNNGKIKKQIGWLPPVTSAEGLVKTIKWYQDEHNT